MFPSLRKLLTKVHPDTLSHLSPSHRSHNEDALKLLLQFTHQKQPNNSINNHNMIKIISFILTDERKIQARLIGNDVQTCVAHLLQQIDNTQQPIPSCPKPPPQKQPKSIITNQQQPPSYYSAPPPTPNFFNPYSPPIQSLLYNKSQYGEDEIKSSIENLFKLENAYTNPLQHFTSQEQQLSFTTLTETLLEMWRTSPLHISQHLTLILSTALGRNVLFVIDKDILFPQIELKHQPSQKPLFLAKNNKRPFIEIQIPYDISILELTKFLIHTFTTSEIWFHFIKQHHIKLIKKKS
jgi:hypothetical protein